MRRHNDCARRSRKFLVCVGFAFAFPHSLTKIPDGSAHMRNYCVNEWGWGYLDLYLYAYAQHSSYQCSWHRGTSSFALALLPCVLACVHVSLVSVLARSVAFSPSPQKFRPLSFLCSVVCAVPMSLSTQVTHFPLALQSARTCCRA